jgi:hypothetical protein
MIDYVLAAVAAFLVFFMFITALSIFQVFWKRFWGNHDE